MANKYWWREESTTTKSSQDQKNSAGKYWWRADDAQEAATRIANRMTILQYKYNNYLSNYQSRYSGRTGTYEDAYVSDSAEWLNTVRAQNSSFEAEAADILSYMDLYKDYLDADWMGAVKDTLSQGKSIQSNILDSAVKDKEFWDSWGTEDRIKEYGSAEEAYKYAQRDDGYRKKYSGMTADELSGIIASFEDGEEKDWLTSYRGAVDYEEKSKYDLEAGAKEIEELERVADEMATVSNQYFAVTNNPGNFTQEQRDEITAKYNALVGQYGTPEEFHNALNKKRLYYTNAQRIQEGIKLAGVADSSSELYDPEFIQYANYAGGKLPLIPDYKDLVYGVVNGDQDAKDGIPMAKGWRKLSDEEGDRLDVVQYMTDDEKALYNYYYNKHGYDTAEEYLDGIIDNLNAQQGAEIFKSLDNKPVLELVFSVAAGLDQFNSGVKNLLNFKDDYIPTSATQYASGMVREDLKDVDLKYYNFKEGQWDDAKIFGSSLGQTLYDRGTTIANMAPSILVSALVSTVSKTAGAVVGNALMGASAAGNAYQEVVNQGYGKAEARMYSTAVGVSESLLQYALGGIGKLGGVSSKLAKAVEGIDDALLRFSIQYGGKFASEALEEGLQEVLDPVFKNAILHADEDVNWSEVAYSALLGGLSAGVFEGVPTVVGVAKEQAYKKRYGESTNELIQIGLESDVNSDSYKLATQYKDKIDAGKTLTGAEIRNLVEANEAQFKKDRYNDTVAKAKSRLTELGEGGNVDDLAQIAAKRATGQNLTRAEISAIASSQFGTKVAKELRDANLAEGGPKSATYKSLEDRVGTESSFKVSEDGQATVSETGEGIDLSKAKVAEFVKDKDGKIVDMVIDVDGKQVKASEVDYADGNQSYLFEAVSKIENITPETATTIIRDYDPTSGQTAGEYLNGVDEAFTYGYYSYSEADMNAGKFAPKLTDTQRKSAYVLGRRDRSMSDTAADAPVVKMRTAAEAKLTAEEKTAKQKAKIESEDTEVYFRDGKKVVKFDEHTGKYDKKRMAAVNTAKFLSKLGIGGKYYFYESYMKDGVRVYKDTNGKEVEAPNGIYMESDGSIHIDLNAGNAGQGTALFTLAHELTHFVKDQSKKQFKILNDLVAEAFDKTDISMHKRVLAKQKFLESKRGKAVSYAEAHEEVVADAMATMLSDGSFYDLVMEIKVKDKGLFATIKRFFKDMIAKFTKEYENLTPDQQDAQDIRQMKDMFDKIQKAFAEALVEASDNFQSTQAQKNTTEEGGVRYMSRDIADVTEDTVRADLTDVFNGNNVTAASYIPLLKTTPFAVRYITGYTDDLPVIVEKKKAYFDMREGGKFKEDSSHHYHGMGVDGFLNAIDILDDPEYAIHEQKSNGKVHYAFISSNKNGEEICVIFQMGVTKSVGQMNGYPGGYYNLDITEFVATDEWLEEHGVEPGTSYKDYLLSFPENSIAYDRSIHLEQLEKARIIDSESAGVAASYDNNRASKNSIRNDAEKVNTKSVEAMDVEMDAKTESVSPAVMKSERTWTASDYVQERNKAAKEIAKAIGVTEKKAKDYIDSINSIAKMIAEDRSRLDYFSSPGRSSFIGNVEYGGSFDFSTLCKKRRLLTGTFTAIQKALPNTALTANEILDIRNRMKDAGLEVSCGLCYVEGSRANMGQFAKEFLRLYKQYYPDAWQPNMADVNTPDGIEWVRINHPECYEQYEYFWNHYGTLKAGDKNLFASQQKPKLYQLHTEYKGEILQKFKDDDNVEEKNINGGIRLQSFSDFEIVHLIDTMQIIMDMSRVGLAGQAYTKVPDFAWALGDTGLKINLSLIAKGVDENGKLIFDDVEGMPIAEAMKLRDRYSKNVGTILVAFNDEQLLAAMADDRVDFIIPFHRSQWKKSQYEAMGLPAKTKDYTYMQNEKFIKPTFHEYRGRMVRDKATNYMPNEYWDFSKSGKENAEAYLEMCARNNKRPKFYKLLQNNGDGSYSLKADGSTDGYWKLLIDFKMYDNDGNGSPQMAVKPEFNMEEANRMLETYKGGHSNFPVAQGVVDGFVKEYKESHKGERFSDRDSKGNQLSKEQQEYFKNSFVRDADGRLMVMYHGTKNGDFTIFDRTKAGKRTGFSIYGKGNYFTVFEDGAANYGSRVIPAYLKIVNPIITSAKTGAFFTDVEKVLGIKASDISLQTVSGLIKEAGYDGVIVYGIGEDEGNIVICVAYDSEQIKDISNKKPTSNPDIRYSYRGVNKNGIEVYETSEATMKLTWADRVSQYEKMLSTNFVGRTARFKRNGHIYYAQFDPNSAGKVLYGEKGMSKDGKKAIIRAGADGDIFDLVENARYDHSAKDKKNHKAKDGFTDYFDYFYKTVQIDGKVFDININVKKQYGSKHGYTYTIKVADNKTMKASPALAVTQPSKVQGTPSATKITQPTPKVNSQNSGTNSERGEDTSNRALLANAFEGLSKSSVEYKMIQDYKEQIKVLNLLDEQLSDLNAQIHEIRFTKGKYDAKKLKALEEKAERMARDINRQDKALIRMEASEPLCKIIEFERKKAAQKTKEHIAEIQQNKKLRAEQTELRHKIRRTVRDLDKLLNRGNKKRNVKEDMQGFVSKALELADYLFTDHISDDDLIRRGITVRMSPQEAALVKETEDILTQLYDNADSLTDEKFTELDAKRKDNEAKLRDLLTSQRNERLSTPVYNLFNDLVTEYASLKNSSQEAVKGAYDPKVEEFLRSYLGETADGTDSDRKTMLQNMRLADMTTEELWKLHNAYTMVLHSVRTANKLFVNGKTESLEQMANRIVADFSQRKAPDGKAKTVIRNLSNKLGWDYEKLYYALDRIGSEAFTELVMNLANSENIVMEDVKEAKAFLRDIVKKYDFNNWDYSKEIDRDFLDTTGKKFRMTLGQLMSLYAYSRREGAWDHIEYGGFVFGETALTNPKPADSYKLSKDQCEAITNTLTKEQKAYVEDMQKFLSETMGAKGNEVSMLLYGIKMFGEKNYFPIHIAGQFKAQANESQAKAAAGFGTMTNAGFTHAQNPNAKAPFVLEGFNEIWADHVNEMSRYHGAVPALEDMRRVMNRSSYSEAEADSVAIKQLMENSFGKEAVDYFDNLYREANSGAIADRMQRGPKKLLSLFRKNSVAYSLSVVIQQPSAMARAYAMIDKKYFGFKGLGALTSGVAKAVTSKWNPAYANAYNEMLKYAPGVTLAKEIGGFDTHTGSSIREYLLDTEKSFKQSMKTENLKGKGKAMLNLVDDNAIANLPNVADKIAWIEIWNACKRETVAKHKDLAVNSEEFMQIVGERFTEVIRATQVYDSIFAKSPLLKSKSLAVQYLVSFMNEPNTTANMVEKAVRDATNGDWKGGARIAGAVAYSIIFNNVLKAIVYAMRDDDEDETYIEKYVAAVTGGLIDDFLPMNYIPVVRDVWSKVRGFDIERPDMAIITDAIDAYQALEKAKDKDTEGMTEEELAEMDKKVTDASWKLVGSIAAFFGIPVKNVYREIDGIINQIKIASANAGMTTPDSIWDKVKEEIADTIPFGTKETKTDRLYDAIVSGDAKYIERIKGTYKTEDSYQSAVRKALRENDPRIHEAAQARINGNTEEYKRIFREIQKEGKFIFDDIMSAINSEESKIRKGVDPEKATSDYTANGYVEAIIMGDSADAKAMKDDIIAAKVANGKTQEEAEKEFNSSVATGIGEAYSSGLLDEAQAEKMLVEHAGKDEEEAASKVSYWSFCEDYPSYKDVFTESHVEKYHEFAEPADISVEIYAQFISGTKGLKDIKDKWGDVEVTKRDQVLEVIDSLDLTFEQKDALYLAAGYSESKIWDVPW